MSATTVKPALDTTALAVEAEKLADVLAQWEVFYCPSEKYLEVEKRGLINGIVRYAENEGTWGYCEMTYSYKSVRLILTVNLKTVKDGENEKTIALLNSVDAYDHPRPQEGFDYKGLSRALKDAVELS